MTSDLSSSNDEVFFPFERIVDLALTVEVVFLTARRATPSIELPWWAKVRGLPDVKSEWTRCCNVFLFVQDFDCSGSLC